MVLTYTEATSKELERKMENQKRKPFNNFTKGKRKALQELRERDDIVRAKTDKGGAEVKIDTKEYLIEAAFQLKNKANYDRLKYDPTKAHTSLVNDTTKRFKNQKMIKEKVVKGLKTENSRAPKFYFRPKIHERGNPGHPVVSSVNCHISNISK